MAPLTCSDPSAYGLKVRNAILRMEKKSQILAASFLICLLTFFVLDISHNS